MNRPDAVIQLAKDAKRAASTVATLTTDQKNEVLLRLAKLISSNAESIKAANEKDLASARTDGLTDAKLRRLVLSDAAIAQMSEGLRQVAALPDPIGQVTLERTVPSGLIVRKIRSPLGVVMMIYEARPNVTVDAFALCFKSSNTCILKGGREASHSNEKLANLAKQALRESKVDESAISPLITSDRDVIKKLLTLEQYIDLVIPRGGETLIRFVHEHARIPTVLHFHGVCHIYVDASADIDQAIEICATAKTSAPATCNAAEAILVHQDIAPKIAPRLIERYIRDGVKVKGDSQIAALANDVEPADEEDWGREFLDLIVAMKVVPDLDAAIEHIQRYGSNHTDAILTTDADAARAFTDRVQSSCTLVNASTRFNDGFQLGLGAEIGISTSKIHAYGPMGLEELTTQRYVVTGNGQYR